MATMSNFTPVASTLGGLLIGLAAAMLWLANGRIAGISGIVGNLPSARSGDVAWRITFLAGLIVAPLGYAALAGAPVIRLDASAPILIAGGLLVGYGTRSAVAAPAVMASAAWRASHPVRSSPPACSWLPGSSRCLSRDTPSEADRMPRLISALLAGVLFGLGLTISHMIDPAKVLGFLDIAGDWDPSLAFVMLGALTVMTPTYALSKRLRAPLCAEDFALPAATRVDQHLILGALLFGAGWGLVGYCPGPALASIGFGGGRTLLFVAAMLVGMAVFTSINRGRAPSGLGRGNAQQL